MVYRLLFLLCSLGWSGYFFEAAAQISFGADIDGEAAGDLSGSAVAYSEDGEYLAVGAPINNSSTGHVRVYNYANNSWIQVGNDIDGEAAGDLSGSAVALSNDGRILAVGAPRNDGNGSNAGHVRVFYRNGNTWTQLGNDIDGEAAGDESGRAVSLSSDGHTLAIGAPQNAGNGYRSGHTRVYRWTGTTWVQLGTDIDGEASSDQNGHAISLSGDGNILAVGARYNVGNGNSGGHTRVYQWNGTTWIQMGNDIDGDAGSRSGYAVSLSQDGNTVAIGAPFGNNANNYSSGHTRVYQWNGTNWLQMGTDIGGINSGDESGRAVVLSANGNRVALCAEAAFTSNRGSTRTYQWDGTTWTQIGINLGGEAIGDQSGSAVAFAINGNRVAIGAPYNDGGGSNAGHVRVFKWCNTQTITQVNVCTSYLWPVDSVYYSTDTIVHYNIQNATSTNCDSILSLYINDVNTINTIVIETDTALVAQAPHATYQWLDCTQNYSRIPGATASSFSPPGNGQYAVEVSYNGCGADTSTCYSFNRPSFDHDTIYGKAAFDYAGTSVCFSMDGKRVAIGGTYTGSYGSNTPLFPGKARVYEWRDSIWIQLGMDISDGVNGDEKGRCVALAADGNRLAVGAHKNLGSYVKVYQWTGHNWEQLGGSLEQFVPRVFNGGGYDIAISADGNRVISGAPYSYGDDRGAANVYEWTGSQWLKAGVYIHGEAIDDLFGSSVDISADGNTIAVGAPQNDGNGQDAGHVRVFKWNGTTWIRLGNDIDGEAAGSLSGTSVSLSADGKTVAIGAPHIYTPSTNPTRGYIRVYHWTGTAWTQVGSTIYSPLNAEIGRNISLSADGYRLATTGAGISSRIYQWDGINWHTTYQFLHGNTSLHLSSGGTKAAFGSSISTGPNNALRMGITNIYQSCEGSHTTIIDTCAAYTWAFDNQTYHNDTVVIHRLAGAAASGCDSVVMLILNIHDFIQDFEFVNGCTSYAWRGQTYTGNGIYIDTTTSTVGCDTLHTLILNAAPIVTTISAVSCSTYTWRGQVYDSTGIYTDTITATNGCDSVLALDLSVPDYYKDSVFATIVGCDTFFWRGEPYLHAGIHTDTVFNSASGCDSLYFLHLTTTQFNMRDTTRVTACDRYSWYMYTFTQSGQYFHTVNTPHSCDTVYSIILTIIPATTHTTTDTACHNYTWRGQTYTASGTYSDTLQAVSGCDSILFLQLVILSDTMTVTACKHYDWRGQRYTSSGYYYDTVSYGGCAVLTLDLTILPPIYMTDTVVDCQGHPWRGQYYAQTGIYTDTTTNAMGCDTIFTLDLQVSPPTYQLDTMAACQSYTWRNQTYTSSGIYSDTTTNALGCDSIFVLDLSIYQPASRSINQVACFSYFWHGNTYTASGRYTDTLTTVWGCDSIVTLGLAIITVDTSVLQNNNTLTANASPAIYQWLDCNNGFAPIAGATTNSFTPTSNGNYAVQIIQNGCSDQSACYAVTNLPPYQTQTTTTTRSSSNGSFAPFPLKPTSSTATTTLPLSIQLLPNPARQQTTLHLSRALDEDVRIEVLDITGKITHAHSLEKGNTQLVLPIHQLPAGVYLVRLIGATTQHIEKLIVE